MLTQDELLKAIKGGNPVHTADGTLVFIPDPILPGEAERFTYYSKHLPSRNVHARSALFLNRNAFERCLQHWNQLGQGTWHYTETNPVESWHHGETKSNEEGGS